MVGLRWAQFLAVLAFAAVISPATPFAIGDDPGPTVLIAEDFAEASDWNFETSWHQHARPGDPTGVAYFGPQDEPLGGSYPSYQDWCGAHSCAGNLSSPWMALPADRPMFLYLWTLNVVASGGFQDAEQTPVWVEHANNTRTLLYHAPSWWKETYKASLDAFRGETIRLVFGVDVLHRMDWLGGLALDDVVVTDADLDTLRVVEVSGTGPGMLVALNLQPDESATIRMTFRGTWTDEGRRIFLCEKGGESQCSSTTTYHAGIIPFEDADVGLVHEESVGAEWPSNWSMPLEETNTFHLRGGYWTDHRFAQAAVGLGNISYTVRVETTTGIAGLAIAFGGNELLAAEGRDIPALVFVGKDDRTLIMEDGHLLATSSNEALVWFEIRASTFVGSAAMPSGPVIFPEHRGWERDAGTYSLDITRIRDSFPGHFVMVVELPHAPEVAIGAPTESPPLP